MKTNRIVFVAAAFLMSTKAFAGVGSSGGGKGVVCRTTAGTVSSVELLDLWEAKNVYGRIIQNSTDPLTVQLSEGLNRISNAIKADGIMTENGHRLTAAEYNRRMLQQTTTEILRTDLPYVHHLHGVKLQLTNDSFETITPETCDIEQIIRFNDYTSGSDIFINQDLFDQLNAVNQAALLVHESLYSFLRLNGEPSSVRVRRAIGIAFSGGGFSSPDQGVPEKVYQCIGDGDQRRRNEVLMYVDSDPAEGGAGVDMEIVRFNGRQTVGFEPRVKLMGYNSVEEVFKFPDSQNLDWGYETGRDYTFELTSKTNQYQQFEIEMSLTSAPDGSTSGPYSLLCNPKNKTDIFN